MNAQNVNQILDALAARFGSTGAHLWQVLIRQVYVEAIRDGIGAIILLVVTGVWFRYLSPRIGKWFEDDEPHKIVPHMIGLIVVAIFAVAVSVAAVNELAQLANPEYGALSYVLDALKPR